MPKNKATRGAPVWIVEPVSEIDRDLAGCSISWIYKILGEK